MLAGSEKPVLPARAGRIDAQSPAPSPGRSCHPALRLLSKVKEMVK
jgi:hypothetical protein